MTDCGVFGQGMRVASVDCNCGRGALAAGCYNDSSVGHSSGDGEEDRCMHHSYNLKINKHCSTWSSNIHTVVDGS